jgi:hypothetical protein
MIVQWPLYAHVLLLVDSIPLNIGKDARPQLCYEDI